LAADGYEITQIFTKDAGSGRGSHRGRDIRRVYADASPSKGHRISTGAATQFKDPISRAEHLESGLDAKSADRLADLVASLDIIV